MQGVRHGPFTYAVLDLDQGGAYDTIQVCLVAALLQALSLPASAVELVPVLTWIVSGSQVCKDK
jgi:hypothetical protein